jgi:hypothetical protein
VDPIAHLARLSTAITARVLRNMADALDAQPASDPVPPLVIHVENLDQALTRTWLDGAKPVRVDAQVTTIGGQQTLAIDLYLYSDVKFSANITDTLQESP